METLLIDTNKPYFVQANYKNLLKIKFHLGLLLYLRKNMASLLVARENKLHPFDHIVNQ